MSKLLPAPQAGGTARLDAFTATVDVIPIPIPPAVWTGLAGLALSALAMRRTARAA